MSKYVGADTLSPGTGHFPTLIIDLTLIRDVQFLIVKDDLDVEFLFFDATVV
jgi:hypothetical protein